MKKEEVKKTRAGVVQEIELKEIEEPKIRIRTVLDEEKMKELASSILLVGLMQPILVSRNGKKFEIVVGHRRYLACKKLGMKKMSAIVVTDRGSNVDVMKLHENLVREDINVVDEAKYLVVLMKRKNLKQQDLAKIIGRTAGYVSQRLAIMDYPIELREAVEHGEITFTVARELSRIDDIGVLNGYLIHAKQSGANSTVISQWVEDYELQKKLASGGDGSSVANYLGGALQEISMPCAVCNGVKPITDTVMMRVCVECKKELGV